MGYSPPVGDMAGVQTAVTQKSHEGYPTDWEREQETNLPPGSATPNSPVEDDKEKHYRKLPYPVVQKPESGSGTVEKEPIKPEEGEQYGVPEKNDYDVPRRRSLTADSYEPRIPWERQHRQPMDERLESKRYYRQRKRRVLNRAKRYYKRIHRNPMYQKRKDLRRERPRKYKRLKMASWDIPFVTGPEMQEGWLLGLSPLGVHYVVGEGDERVMDPMRFMDSVVFLSDEDIDLVAEKVARWHSKKKLSENTDLVLNDSWLSPLDDEDDLEDADPEEVQKAQEMVSRVAFRYAGDIILYDQQAPTSQETAYGPQLSTDDDDRRPGEGEDTDYYSTSPGLSNRVVPPGDGTDLVRFEASLRKSAATMADISSHTGPDVHQKAPKIALQLHRADPTRGIWAFKAAGSKGESYMVRIKGIKEKGITKLTTARVQVSCTCPFFRWQGPEHWAKVNGYLYGKPQGTATLPAIKDPKSEHWACKHLLALFKQAQTYRLASGDSWQAFLRDAQIEPVVEPSPELVAALFVAKHR